MRSAVGDQNGHVRNITNISLVNGSVTDEKFKPVVAEQSVVDRLAGNISLRGNMISDKDKTFVENPAFVGDGVRSDLGTASGCLWWKYLLLSSSFRCRFSITSERIISNNVTQINKIIAHVPGNGEM